MLSRIWVPPLGFLFFLLAGWMASACSLKVSVPLESPPEPWNPPGHAHPDRAAFQQLLDRYVEAGLPGVVLMVSSPQGQWTGAAGYAKIETDQVMLPTHRHHAASMTKMYTATAVLHLVEEGRLDLDAKISEYLPESLYGAVPNGPAATLRQLLGHTSGIPDFSGDMRYDLDTFNDPLGSFPPEKMLAYLHRQSQIFSPGSGYFYSNANYLLLALIMDEVTESGHAGVISEAILRPLGLRSTYYKNEEGYPNPPGLVNSYQDLAGNGQLVNGSDLARRSAEVSVGYAGLIATAGDFGRFIEALLGGKILGEAMVRKMMLRTESSRYGLGLSFVDTPFGLGVGHGGGSFGILSEVRHFPDLGTTLVLLSNGGDGGGPARLFRDLWDEAVETALGDQTR